MNTTRDQNEKGGQMDALVGQVVIKGNKIRLKAEKMDVNFTVDWEDEHSRECACASVGMFFGDIFKAALVQRGVKPTVKPTKLGEITGEN